MFASGTVSGPVDIEWLGPLPEPTGIATGNRVFATTLVTPFVCVAGLVNSGPLGVAVAVLGATAFLLGVGTGVGRFVVRRRDRRPTSVAG